MIEVLVNFLELFFLGIMCVLIYYWTRPRTQRIFLKLVLTRFIGLEQASSWLEANRSSIDFGGGIVAPLLISSFFGFALAGILDFDRNFTLLFTLFFGAGGLGVSRLLEPKQNQDEIAS